MIRCTECGHENMDGLEYCDACGAKLPAAAGVEPAAEAAVEMNAAPAPASEASEPLETSPADTQPAPVTVSTPAPVAIPVVTAVHSAKLTVIRGGTVGKEFPLQAGDNLVGRWDP